MNDSILDKILGVGLAAMLFVVVALLAGVLVEGVAMYRAHDATVECRAQRMESMRRPLSANVRCVPVLMRQDTTTVHLPQR